jgi:hypothetical protein
VSHERNCGNADTLQPMTIEVGARSTRNRRLIARRAIIGLFLFITIIMAWSKYNECVSPTLLGGYIDKAGRVIVNRLPGSSPRYCAGTNVIDGAAFFLVCFGLIRAFDAAIASVWRRVHRAKV